MTKDEALKLALEALENNRKTHHYCEDTWYSCPKHEDGCANDSEGDECNCGADKANAEIDKAITAIKEALAQPDERNFCQRCGKRTADLTTIHTCTPPHDNALQRGLSKTKEVVAGSQAFYGFPHGPVSTPNAGGKCVTAGETAPKEST